ncbi:MAG TPA: hypothetical protein VMV94_09245 [Phycisphaerae bacterium]|nr:hypothetical protein [Phycisphaerae bacterium]
MQNHLEEFSVTDVRHTLGEVWRVVCSRRWYFVFPFCTVSTIALLCSLWVPRQYAGSTVIKREHDPVFASMAGENWTQPYNEIRQRMNQDLKDLSVIEQILEDMKLPEGLESFANGELTPMSIAARQAFAAEIAAGLKTTPLETSPQRDVISIGLTLSDAEHLPDILQRIRDRYISTARSKTTKVLREVEQFFQSESDRCRSQLAEVQKQLLEYELQYPGIDPEVTDKSRAEDAALVVERIQLERTIADLTEKRKAAADKAAGSFNASQPMVRPEDSLQPTGPNPRYAEIQREIEKVLREITDGRTVRFMTEQHPVIQRLRTRLKSLQEELSQTPPEQVITAKLPASPEAAREAEEAAARDREQRLADADAKIGAARGRQSEIEAQLKKLEEHRALAVEHRQDYLKVKREAGRLENELNAWAQNLGPIRHVMTVEDRDRTIHFTMIEDVRQVEKPVLPSIRNLMIICFGIGLAVGALTMLFVELVDRSYRTVKQLGTSLGIPVIEGIDEIVSQAVARKRMIRKYFLVPAAAVAAVSAMFLATTLAYLSVESPGAYEALRSTPAHAYQFVIGAK